MNERIQELAEQSMETVDVSEKLGIPGTDLVFNKERFAKLIVRECVEFAYKEADHLEDEFERGRADDLRRWANVMKQHFGVFRS